MTAIRWLGIVAAVCVFAGCKTWGPSRNGSTFRTEEQSSSADHASPSAPLPAATVQPVAYQEPLSDSALDSEPVRVPEPQFTPTESDELTLRDLEEMALMSNPSLSEKQARIDAARGRWLQNGLPPNTVLGYSGQQLGSHGQSEQNGVYIEQEFVRGGKLRLARGVADQEIAIAERQLEAQQRRVLTDVQLGYYEVLVAQRRLEIQQQMVNIAGESSKAADALLRAQEASQADVLRARVELQTNELALRVSQNQLNAAWTRLVSAVGTPQLPIQKLAGKLDRPELELSYDAVLGRLLIESPELHAVLLEIERSRCALAQAHAQGVPNIKVEGILQYDNSTDGSNGNLQVSMPIPWLNYNQGGIREAQANLVSAQMAVGRVELGLQNRLASVYQRYATARDQVADYSKPDGILENVNNTLDMVRRGYQAGEFGYLDLLTAQRSYAQTNLAYVEAIGELWAAIVEIEGLLLKNSFD